MPLQQCWAIGRICGCAILAALALTVGLVGLSESLGLVDLPFVLLKLRDRLPLIFPLHMGASALALILIVPVLALRRKPRWHRFWGRATLVLVLVGGVASLASALMSSASPAARAGFFAQGLVWLALAVIGFVAIRRRSIALHRAAMLSMAAVAFGAVVLRLMLAAAFWLARDASPIYGAVAWSSWMIPLAMVALFIRPPPKLSRP